MTTPTQSRLLHRSAIIGLLIALAILPSMLKTIRHHSTIQYGIFLQIQSISEAHSFFLNVFRNCNQTFYSTKSQCLSESAYLTEKKHPTVLIEDILYDSLPYTDWNYPNFSTIILKSITFEYF